MDAPQPSPIGPPPGAPEPPPTRRRLLVWVVAGLGALVLLQICALVALLVAFPELRTRLPVIGARPGAPPPPESPLTTTTPMPAGPVRIEESFDQPTTRWEQSLARVVDGAYELRLDIPNYDSYGLLLSEGLIDDFDMAVDVQQIAGDPTSEYGIRFRQSGPGDYLMFSISGSGYYRLLRVQKQTYRSLVPWTFDPRIKTGPQAVNRLRVIAKGPSITAFVNDAQVLSANDEINVGGQLTLGVTTFDSGGLVVRFDNIAGQAGQLDLGEDFSNPEAASWSIGGATIVEGAYEIFAGPGIRSWQQPLPTGSSRVGDFTLDVDTTLVRGSGDGVAYGVMFGDGGSFDFYSLYLLPQGGVVLLRSESDGTDTLIIPPVELQAVKSGTGATNHIHLEVRGRAITVTINGEQLPAVEAPTPVRGMVGLIVSSGTTDSVQARFDNFRLEELP